MSIAEDIASEIVAVMEAVKRHDLAAALQHQEVALKFTGFALRALEIEISLRELHKMPIGPLPSMQKMYRDIERCLADQKTAIERLAVVFAKIQAEHSGVVGKS